MTYWKVNPAAQHWRTQNAPFFLLLLLLLLVLTCAHVVSGLSHTCRYLGYPIRMYVQGRHEGGGLCQERRLKHTNSFTLEAHKVLYTEAYTSKEKGVETEHRQLPYWKHFKPATTSYSSILKENIFTLKHTKPCTLTLVADSPETLHSLLKGTSE